MKSKVEGGSFQEVTYTVKSEVRRPFCLRLWLLEAILCEDRTKKHLLVYFEMCYQLIVNILHEIVCVCVRVEEV